MSEVLVIRKAGGVVSFYPYTKEALKAEIEAGDWRGFSNMTQMNFSNYMPDNTYYVLDFKVLVPKEKVILTFD